MSGKKSWKIDLELLKTWSGTIKNCFIIKYEFLFKIPVITKIKKNVTLYILKISKYWHWTLICVFSHYAQDLELSLDDNIPN